MKKPDKIIQMNSNIAAKAERNQYEQDRETIKRGMASFVETGTALARVRDSRSFELGGYDSFEKFCNAEFGFSPQYGNKLIDAASVVKGLPAKISETIVSEGQARALAKAPEKERAAIIREVAKEGPVTARAIAEEIATRKEPKAKPVEAEFSEVRKDEIFDRNGVPVPDSIRTTWNGIQAEFDDMQLHTHAILDMWPANLCGPLPEAVKKALSSILLTLDIQVCPACKGQTCKQCGRRGVVSGRPFVK